PRVPHDWKEYAIEYRHGSAMYAISVSRADGSGLRVSVDGREVSNGEVTLVDDGLRHEVLVTRDDPTLASESSAEMPAVDSAVD
ncbi:MAG: hypothetical protein ACRENU_06570, partial [Gemmatimonadaceae bacterium]